MLKKQFSRFIVVGVFSTIVNYSIFYILYEFASFYYTLASAMGFIAGVFAGYGFNLAWTFEAKGQYAQYIYKYYIVYTVSLFLGLGFLEFLVSALSVIPEIANVLTIGLTTCTNFMGTKFWVFKR